MGVPRVFPSKVPERIFHPVGLLARRDNRRLPRTAAIQIGLNVRLDQTEARGAAIDDDADTAAVGFPPGGDAKQLSERISHRGILKFKHQRSKSKIPGFSCLLLFEDFADGPLKFVQ